MNFKKFMCSIGFGTMKVDTVVETPNLAEGDILNGKIYIEGGDSEQDIEYIELQVLRRIEKESKYSDFDVHDDLVTRQMLDLAGAINSKETRILQFSIVPDERWELSDSHSRLVLRTIVHIDNGVDVSDEDEITYVQPRTY